MTRFPRGPHIHTDTRALTHLYVCLHTPSSMLCLRIACICSILYCLLCYVRIQYTKIHYIKCIIQTVNGDEREYIQQHRIATSLYSPKFSSIFIYLHVFPIWSWSFGRLLEFSSLYIRNSVQFVTVVFREETKGEKKRSHLHILPATHKHTHVYYTF